MRDKFRVLVDEYFAGRPKIELIGMIAEEFPMDPGPDQASVGVDVDLGDTEFGCGKVFIFIHASRRRIELPTGGVDSFYFLDRHAGAAMHHYWRSGNPFFDLLDDVEMQALFAFEFVGAVAGPDGSSERITTGLLNELNRLIGIGQGSVAFIDLDVLLHPTQSAQLGLDTDPFFVSAIDNSFRNRDVIGERVVTGVDHDRAVEARVDAIVAGFFIAVVKMDSEDCLFEHLVRRADERFQHSLVGVLSRPF